MAESWDNEPVVSKFRMMGVSGGSGDTGFTGGFGAGRGKFLSTVQPSNDNTNGYGSTFSSNNAESKPSSFGGGGSMWGAGGGSQISNNTSSNGGGFGGRGNSSFGGGGSSSFGQSNGSGGGFGSRSGGGGGGGSGCHRCGEEGHFSRECPKGGGGGSGGRGCHKCGEEGHFARECPTGGGGGGGSGGRGCHKCGEEGHFARECPTGGGGGGGSRGCFKCGADGHMARDCTEEPKEGEEERKPVTYVPPPPPEGESEIFQSMLTGINFDKYDEIPVEVTGDNAPAKVNTFEEANLAETFYNNVKKANYKKPTPVQKYSIPIIMSGRDLMACAQTGSGKTAAFLLPILTSMVRNNYITTGSLSMTQEPACVIVAPTRELAVQICSEARKFAFSTIVRPVVAYGGVSVQHQLREIERGCNILIATPGRLLDFISRRKISVAKVKFLVLDEADRMLDMGFQPEIRRLVEQLGMPPKEQRQTLMFSATFPDDVQRLAADFLNNYLFLTVGRLGGANYDVTQSIVNVNDDAKRDKLVEILQTIGNDRTLVFVEQKRRADFLAAFLSQEHFPTTSIHGDREQREREEALRDFRLGHAPILVATSVAARGLDIPKVQVVINYDLPKGVDEYVHRIGRTGRVGNLGKSISFYDANTDKDLARSLVKVLSDAYQDIPDWLESEAENAVGSGFGAAGGNFGGRDMRQRGGRGGGGGDRHLGNAGPSASSGSGFGGGGGGFTAGDDDESWD